ncbi:hypothetical protein UFOVP67_7 [uncultured Caudovirales phage]|uniref:Uncharacterized protein n=1 Tax=uncultured Caudovirales phage TaxID=2100421 RepID=A0A6J5T8S2_9CAUD|nr:hypothetical protein UFOVP67_7 [uncultured Caudovirales phage]
MTNPYKKQLPVGLTTVDVYDVLRLFNVTDPCLQHAIKKLLCPGQRVGGKSFKQDLEEAKDSIVRAIDTIEYFRPSGEAAKETEAEKVLTDVLVDIGVQNHFTKPVDIKQYNPEPKYYLDDKWLG